MPSDKSQSVFARVVLSALLAATLATSAAVAKERVLYTFTGGSDGANPNSALVFDAAGNLYGTADSGGAYGFGAVFELIPSQDGWTETILYSFISYTDGDEPIGPLLFDKQGNLFGLTRQGGPTSLGIAFELSPNGSGGWSKQTLYAFAGGSDGALPNTGLIADDEGNLYGGTVYGGTGDCSDFTPGCGTIFQLKPTNGSWKEIVLYRLPGGDSGAWVTSLTRDSRGDFYGTAFRGGSDGGGLVFKLNRMGGHWTESIIHTFTSGRDGFSPYGGIILDPAGNIYGTTTNGGGGGCLQGCGVVFELEHLAHGKWKEIILHRFKSNNYDGLNPSTALVFDPAGNLYGTAGGGTFAAGIAFELMKNFDGKWVESIIYDFTGTNDGIYPGPLAIGKDGRLYGTALGGAYDAGLVFQLSP